MLRWRPVREPIPLMHTHKRQPIVDLWRIACDEARRLARNKLAELRREAESRRDKALESAEQEKRNREKLEYEYRLLKERLADKDKARAEAVDEIGRLRQELRSVSADFNRHQAESRATIDKAKAEADKARQVQQTTAQHAEARHQEMQRLLDRADSRYEADAEMWRRQLETAQRATKKEGEADLGTKLAEAKAALKQSKRETANLHEQLAEQKQLAEQQRVDYQEALQVCRQTLQTNAGREK